MGGISFWDAAWNFIKNGTIEAYFEGWEYKTLTLRVSAFENHIKWAFLDLYCVTFWRVICWFVSIIKFNMLFSAKHLKYLLIYGIIINVKRKYMWYLAWYYFDTKKWNKAKEYGDLREKTWISQLNTKQICLVLRKLCRVGIKRTRTPESRTLSGVFCNMNIH